VTRVIAVVASLVLTLYLVATERPQGALLLVPFLLLACLNAQLRRGRASRGAVLVALAQSERES
jgi:hypothetical protein